MTEDDLPSDVKRLLATFRMASTILLDVGKVAGVISIPVSTWLFVRYLSAVSAPFPVAASTLPTLFGVLMVMIAFVAITLAGSMLLLLYLQATPFLWMRLRREVPYLRAHVIPFRWSKLQPIRRDPPAERKMRRRRRRFSNQALRDYCFVYAPFLAVWVCNMLGSIFGWLPSASTFLLVMLTCFLVGGGISAVTFYFWRSNLLIDGAKESRILRTNKFILIGFVESALTALSLIPFLFISEVVGLAEPKLFGLIVLFAILVAHITTNISRFPPLTTTLFGIVILFFALSSALGAPMYSGIALRMLGIGGGLARDVVLQTADPATGKSVVKVLRGCVLIVTGSEIAIHPATDINQCVFPRLLHDSVDNQDHWQVEVYPASSIIRMTRWLQSQSVSAAPTSSGQ